MFEVRRYGFFNLWLLLFFIVAIVGSAALNIYLVLSSLFLIYHFFKKNFVHEVQSKNWITFYLIFFVFIVANSLNAIDFYSSLKSSVSQIRFFLFSLLIMFFLKIENIPKLIFSLSILNIFVCFDTIFQYFYGVDFFGIPATPETNPGRYSGPFGSELIVGTYLYLSSSVIFAYFILNKTKNLKEIFYRFFYITLTINTIILSGERMNTILAIVTILILIFFKFKKTQKILITFSFLLFLIFFYNSNKVIQVRFNIFVHDVMLLHNSNHGKIFSSAYDIWQDNFFTGVGLKNFRIVCDENKINTFTKRKNLCSSHPHNFYFEILSETGIIGLILFFIFIISFIKSFLKKINFKLLADPMIIGSALIILFYLFPIRSSGSFFSTWFGSFFWFHLGILFCYLNTNLKNEKY